MQLSTKTKIIVYSHGIAVKVGMPRCREALIDFCYSLAQFDWVKAPPRWKLTKVMKRIFAGATKDRKEFRFHRNNLDEVQQHLDRFGIHASKTELEYKSAPDALPVHHIMTTDREPWEDQVGLIEFLARTDMPIKVTTLQTGKGKTFCALSAMKLIGVRTIIQLRGAYVHRWIDDLEELFLYKKGEILVIRGRDAMLSLINLAKNDDLDEVKIIIITNKTIFNLLKDYEADGIDNQYGISPEELYEITRTGLRIVDEAHEDYHLGFRSDIYSNVDTSIHLSATLDTEDAQRRRFYDIALPQDAWYKQLEYDKYVGVTALLFCSEDPDKIKIHEQGRDTYSHTAYEKSIMHHKSMLDNYLGLIENVVVGQYLDDEWESGQVCIVFCAMVDMCEIVTEYLKKRLFDLVIQTYVGETDESVLKSSDIIVTTIGSAGTAQDIKGLKTAIMTTAIKKKEANEQVKGRLRRMAKWPELTPKFFYFVNTDISKHVDYHEAKMLQFEGKCLYHRVDHLPFKL